VSGPTDPDAAYWFDFARDAAQNPEGWRYAAGMLKVGADKLLDAHIEETRRIHDAYEQAGQAGRRDLSEIYAELEVGPFLTPIYLMLSGLAIENLAKGIAVARNPQHGEPNDKGIVVKWGHLNSGLLTGFGIKLDANERVLVDRLATFVDWAGRYPVAREVEKMVRHFQLMFSAERDAIDALFKRLDEELVAVLPLHRERRERKLLERGVEFYVKLGLLPTEEIDGVVYFVDVDGEAAPLWVATYCGACSTQINLGERTPAALCRCGDFHYSWIWWDGSLGRAIPGNDVLPRSEIPTMA
jgi:hypothetical protein